MTLSQIDKIRGNYVMENAGYFREALTNIHDKVMDLTAESNNVYALNYFIGNRFPKIAADEFNKAYNRMWERTPVFFAQETFKELSNTKSLADIFNPINYFRRGMAIRIQMVTRTTQNKYNGIIEEGSSMTDDIRKIATMMDESIRGTYIKLRAMQISRTETVFASNVGRRAGAMATGLPITKTWVTAGDVNVRVNHAIVNGQRKPLNEPFVVGGEIMMFPSDFTHGATAGNLVNCRCIESYSIS